MGLIKLFPSAMETIVSAPVVPASLPSTVEFIDTDTFESAVNTILNKYDTRLTLSTSKVEEVNSLLAIKGSVRNHCEVVCLFVSYIEGYNAEPCQVNLSFNVTMRGTACIRTHIANNILYFDDILEDNTEKIGRWE